jgi:hypothetical protein
MEPSFEIGQKVFALNLKYRDGTRLRSGPSAQSGFNGVWLPNDVEVEILKISPAHSNQQQSSDNPSTTTSATSSHSSTTEAPFALIRKKDGDSGWARQTNLSAKQRVAGVTKDVVSSELVTPDPEYVRGIKIYNCGILEDVVAGSKFGKGLQVDREFICLFDLLCFCLFV